MMNGKTAQARTDELKALGITWGVGASSGGYVGWAQHGTDYDNSPIYGDIDAAEKAARSLAEDQATAFVTHLLSKTLRAAQVAFVKAKLDVDPNGELFTDAVDSLNKASNAIAWASARRARLLNHAAACEDRYKDETIAQAARWLHLVNASIALADAALTVVHIEQQA
jgi:hypothetical protein